MSKSNFDAPGPRERRRTLQANLSVGGSGAKSAMIELQGLLMYYNYGINPLPDIRKCFYEFRWEHLEYQPHWSKKIAGKLRTTADFVWAVPERGIVIASIEDRRLVRGYIHWLRWGIQDVKWAPREEFVVNFEVLLL